MELAWFAAVVGIGVFADFGATTRLHFLRAPMRPGMRAVAVLAVACYLAWFASFGGEMPPAFLATGMALHFAAFALFRWAVAVTRGANRLALDFAPDEPRELITAGPYRWIRHPFYAAYSLYWIGCVVSMRSWIVAGLALALIALHLRAALQEEARFAASPFAGAYAEYRRTAGLMWPILGRFSKARGARR